MSKVPVQVVVAAYRDEGAADQVADALKRAKGSKFRGHFDQPLQRG